MFEVDMLMLSLQWEASFYLIYLQQIHRPAKHKATSLIVDSYRPNGARSTARWAMEKGGSLAATKSRTTRPFSLEDSHGWQLLSAAWFLKVFQEKVETMDGAEL